MRTVDERVVAVRRRTRRLRRRRADLILAAPLCLVALLLIDLAGGYATGSRPASPVPGTGLFGASSLFGPSAGGYVLVAVMSFAMAVLVTVLLMMRKRSKKDGKDEEVPHEAKRQ